MLNNVFSKLCHHLMLLNRTHWAPQCNHLNSLVSFHLLCGKPPGCYAEDVLYIISRSLSLSAPPPLSLWLPNPRTCIFDKEDIRREEGGGFGGRWDEGSEEGRQGGWGELLMIKFSGIVFAFLTAASRAALHFTGGGKILHSSCLFNWI